MRVVAASENTIGEQPKVQSEIRKTETHKAAEEDKHPFTVRVVDPNGKPVADAHVGRIAGRMARNSAEWHFQGIFTHTISGGIPHSDVKPAITDANGRTQMFMDDMPRTMPDLAVVACQDSKHLVGVATVSREALRSASKNKSPIIVSLQPECRVHGQVQSTGLEKLGQRPKFCWANVELNGNPIFTFYSEEMDFEFFLPPGTYTLAANGGNDTYLLLKPFTVTAGSTDLNLGVVDVPPANMVKLVGQPAPEIAEVVAWKNSKPLKLADLHGNYVLLEFFGHSCGPCIHAMPKVFELHDQSSKRGLIIIGVDVGLDNDSIDSVDKLDAALAESRKEVWGGRDLPFPVAIVASERKKYPGTERPARSQASVDYGAQSYPSQVLIDREGKVVGWFKESEHLKLFEALPKAE